ncbi:MAG TPA: DUF2508 family protein [Clostridiaceae bacterium]|nr:DUF2508 family protein [Clostridiaceae bacterium]
MTLKKPTKFNKVKVQDAIPSEHKALLEEIRKVAMQLECANTMFNYATDPKLTESAIHEINSCQLRYDYLVKEAKAKGLTFNLHSNL